MIRHDSKGHNISSHALPFRTNINYYRLDNDDDSENDVELGGLYTRNKVDVHKTMNSFSCMRWHWEKKETETEGKEDKMRLFSQYVYILFVVVKYF